MQTDPEMVQLLVLNDGETFTDLDGCIIIEADSALVDEHADRIRGVLGDPSARLVAVFGPYAPLPLSSRLYDGDAVDLPSVDRTMLADELRRLADDLVTAPGAVVAEIAAIWLPELRRLVVPSRDRCEH